MTWASQNIGNVMMGGLILTSLVLLRSMVKSIPPSDPVPNLGASTLPFRRETDSAPLATGATHSAPDSRDRPRLHLNKGPTLKDDLTGIVREDPEAAASILRAWIGNAS